MDAHGENGRWTLRGEVAARRAIQRVVALRGGQFRRVGERRQMWEHDELIAYRIALIGIARARKQPVVLIEGRRIVGERQTQPGEIRVTRSRALALIHAQRHREAAAIDLAPADAVRVADLEPKRRRGDGYAGLGIVDEAQRVHFRCVGTRVHRKRAHRVEPARGDVGDRQVVALIETVREREPGATRVDVIVLPLLQGLPIERALTLDGAVDRLATGSAGDRAHAPGILVAVRGRRDRSAPEYAERTDREGVGA